MDRNQQRESELVALSTAALVTYHQVMGSTFEPLDVPHANAVLREVARAISNVAPICAAASATQQAKVLPDSELLSGEFLRGASVLRTSRGVEYRQLSIRRVDMRSAIAILRRAGVKFTTCRTEKKAPTSRDAGAPARKNVERSSTLYGAALRWPMKPCTATGSKFVS